jgi:hypothetical protein
MVDDKKQFIHDSNYRQAALQNNFTESILLLMRVRGVSLEDLAFKMHTCEYELSNMLDGYDILSFLDIGRLFVALDIKSLYHFNNIMKDIYDERY